MKPAKSIGCGLNDREPSKLNCLAHPLRRSRLLVPLQCEQRSKAALQQRYKWERSHHTVTRFPCS